MCDKEMEPRRNNPECPVCYNCFPSGSSHNRANKFRYDLGVFYPTVEIKQFKKSPRFIKGQHTPKINIKNKVPNYKKMWSKKNEKENIKLS